MKFLPDQPLEQRLKQVHITKVAMYAGQVFFVIVALLNYYLPTPFLGGREISYLFVFIAIFQFLVTKFFLVPRLIKKAHENLPE